MGNNNNTLLDYTLFIPIKQLYREFNEHRFCSCVDIFLNQLINSFRSHFILRSNAYC